MSGLWVAAVSGAALVLSSLVAGLFSWLVTRGSRRAEKRRDVLAEMDSYIAALKDDVATLREDRKADREHLETLQGEVDVLRSERAADVARMTLALAHITHLEGLVPPPPPPRPIGL